MHPLERDMREAYQEMEMAQEMRLKLERLHHPERFAWVKRGAPPAMTEYKRERLKVATQVRLGEADLQYYKDREQAAKEELEELAKEHPLWEHIQYIKGLGPYLSGAFVVAGGEITKAPTVSAFWSGMGLGLNPDGTVPRRTRGSKGKSKTIPAMPHVTRIGEQIRHQILRTDGKLRVEYDRWRKFYNAKYPEGPKIRQMKAALRATQKLFYACLWKAWREAYGLPVPEPYAFALLQHDSQRPLDIRDYYER